MWAMVGAAFLSIGAAFLIKNQKATETDRKTNSNWQGIIRQPAFLRAVAVSTTVLFALDVIMTYFPLYGHEMGLSVSAIGWVLSARALVSMAVRPFMGPVVERLGTPTVLGASLVLGGGAIAAFASTKSLVLLIPVAVIAGISLGLTQPLTLVMVSEAVEPGQLGRAMSFRLMGNRLAQTVSPVVFGLLASTIGLAPVFWVSGGVLAFSYFAIAGRRFGRQAQAASTEK